jgi:hypothetical protein
MVARMIIQASFWSAVCGDVHPDDERQVRGLGRGDAEVPRPPAAHQRGDEHVVPEAGYGEELGDALNQPDDQRLRIGDVRIHRAPSPRNKRTLRPPRFHAIVPAGRERAMKSDCRLAGITC